MAKVIRKADILLIAAIVVIGVWLSAVLVFGKDEGETLTVTVNGEVYGTYDTNKDNEITVEKDGSVNTFEIKNGKVSMINANCQGQDCVHEHSISRQGEVIVCLPHKLILEITGDEGEVDAVVR